MKKKVFSLMMTLLLAFVGVAKAEVVEIGTGTSTTYMVPFNSLYNYSFTEQVFLASEIGTAGNINSISFHIGQAYTSEQTNDVVLYMKNVSRETFSSTTDYEPVTAGDIVFQGQWTIPVCSAGDWITLTLDTPFAYDGTSNLMIAMDENTGSYQTRYFYCTSVTNSGICYYSDSYNPDPYNLDSYSGSKVLRSNRSNIQLDITAGGGAGAPYEAQIGEGTSTTGYFPFYTLYNYSISENLFLASELTEAGVQPGQVTSLSWYATNETGYAQQGISIWMANVSDTELTTTSHVTTGMTLVYTGSMTPATGWNEFPCNAGTFTWDGTSNVLIFCQRNNGDWNSTVYWQAGTVGFNAMAYRYQDSGAYDVTVANTMYTSQIRSNIIIKGVGAGSGPVGDQIFAIQNGVEVDTINVGSRPNGYWMEPFTFQLRNDGPATNVSIIDFTPTDYFTLVAPELPVHMAHNEVIDVQLNTGNSPEATAWQMAAIYDGGGRTARVWDIMAEPYDAQTPDVWELACTHPITQGFPFVEIPANVHNTVLHNDYTLPFPEIPEGEDAVYKLVFDQDAILDARVSIGENGKVALYTEDFYGEGGPMATNYYQGPGIGTIAAPYEAQIGEGTSTSGYLPFYCFYNYSLSQQLFLASELAEAGVTGADMSSLSWYCTATNGNLQSNITIWMANVAETAVNAASPLTNTMNKVYEGNMTPVVGWNEFVFNAGGFAWDGQSNILICVQRNNGAWASGVNWQVGVQNFTAAAYKYSDTEGPYNMEANSYSMTTTTNRANIIMKSDGRSRDAFTFDFEGGLQGWTSIDADYDGNSWFYSLDHVLYDYSGMGNNGSDGFAASASYDDMTGQSYHTNNYLVSPQKYLIADGGNVNFYYTYGSATWYDYFEVCVSTATYPTASSFTSVWTSNDMGAKGQKSSVRYDANRNRSWTPVTVDLSAYAGQEVWIAFRHYDFDMYEIWIDDVTINAASENPEPAPGTVSFGPIINDMPVEAGTYYLVASSTSPHFQVTINADDMPCPEVDGFAFNPTPADDEDGIEPGSVTLRWNIPAYATGWRLIFGTTYYPDPAHPQTIMFPEDGSFCPTLANSYTVRHLWNNTNYFWRVEFNNNGACPNGVSSPIWGFTTHLNVPQNLTVVDETVFDDEQIILNWNPVVDRTYRMYRVYRDGQLIGNTTTNQINLSTYTDGPLAYNMTGYNYYVTAVYDEGESAPSNTVNVKVSGYGDVNGHVYEQDGTTGVAGATVTMVGRDEFNVAHTYNFQTNGQGYYSGHIYAGSYNGQAAKDGYQTITEPVQGNPIAMVYNTVTSPIDYMLDENFDPVCTVIAQYYPDSLDPNSPYVKVYWGCGLPGEEIIEPFETGDFSMFDWQIDPTYPWSITTTNPYEGAYCMKSGGAGVANVVSNMTVTVNIPADGEMSFWGKISCESNWDYGYFLIDGTQMGQYTGAGSWGEKKFNITAGDHTFQWRYTKDGSVNSNDDCFYVDYITFYKRPEPAGPGWHTYLESDFDNAYRSNVGDPSWGYEYPTSVLAQYAGYNLTKVAVFSDDMYGAVGGNFTCDVYVGGSTPGAGTLASTITVDVPVSLGAWCEYDLNNAVNVTGNDPIWVIWTVNTYGGMGYPAGCASHSSQYGDWWNPGDGSGWVHMDGATWTMKNYFTNRGRTVVLGSAEMANAPMNVMQGANFSTNLRKYAKGEEMNNFAESINPNAEVVPMTSVNNTRTLSHYRIYRTNCYNDGPYTEDNTVLLATNWPGDTVYIDVEWADLPAGVYKWGVGCVYEGNRGEMVESPINWAAPVAVNQVAPLSADAHYNTALEMTPEQMAAMQQTMRGVTINRDNEAYANVAYALSWAPAGYNQFDITNLSNYSNLGSALVNRGGDYADGFFYGYDSNGTFYKIDPATGTSVDSHSTGYVSMVAMAYNYANNTMYAIDNSTSGNSRLVTVDLTTGVTTEVGFMGVSIMTLSIDLNGNAYGIQITTGDFHSIDLTTGATTLIGSTGQSVNYVQSANFDHNTETLYWFQCYSATEMGLYTVNTTTGAATLVQAGMGEITSFFVPFTYTPGPTPGPGSNNLNWLAEPRESETIWSNCLDKDMFLEGDVTVNVLLNSADSPEGVQVTFTNYNEAEQEMYPIAPIILDQTGYYVFDSFRKGEYNVKVEFDGYVTITDSVSIWEPTDLRYVMTEIIYNINNLYVSSTGWAMWDAQGIPGGGGGGQGGQGDTFSVNFDDSQMPAGWTTIDANNDGYDWVLGSQIGGVYLVSGASLAGSGHNASNDLICSGSYSNYSGAAINPDNYLVSPQVNLAAGSTFSFWACAQDAGYPAEHFGVFVSDNGTSDWTEVQSWTMTAKGVGETMSIGRDGQMRAQGNWYQKTVDLGAYAGQKYIAIRHFSCYDQFILDIDDIELTSGAKSDDRHLEHFKVMCTSLDGEPIFNANTPADQPFCQLATESLVPGDHYICKVAAVYSTGMSDWVQAEWQYIPCDNYAGTVNGISVNGNTVTWDYPGGGTGPTPPGQGDTFSINFDDSQIPAGWTVIDGGSPAGYGWQIGSIKLGSTGNGHNGSADLILSQSYDNNYGVVYPDNWFISPAVTLGSGSQFSLWACGQDANYAGEHFGVFVSTTGTNPSDFTMVGEWTLTAKGDRYDGPRGNRDQGNWYQKTVDLGDFAGEGRYIAVRHFNCSDMFYLDVDDLELTNGAKSNRNAWDLMMTFTAPEGGHYGVAYDGNNFYTSNWGYSSAAHNFYKYDLQGNMLEGFEIAGCGTLRGITYDGTYFYGVANSSTVYCVDLANHSVVSTFSSSYGAMRGITYDPERDGFWVIGNWSGNLTLIDRTGAIQQTGPAPESASDLAYYKDENDVEHIYCFNNGTNDVNDWVIGNTTMGGSVFNFSNVPGYDAGSSGGCTVGSFNGKIAFIGDLQQSPNLIGIYELRDDNTTPTPPPTPSGDILGAMIFVDGEWEAFVPVPTNTYTYEGEGNNICVRMVYNGTNNLPEGNIYYSMSCPECEDIIPGPGACEPGAPIHVENLYESDQIRVWWGEEPQPPMEDWLYYDDGQNVDAIGLQSGGSFYWGIKFPAAAMSQYDGCSVTKIGYFDYAAHTGTVRIYNGSNGNAPATLIGTYSYTANGTESYVEWDIPAVAFDANQDLWIVMNNNDGQYVAALGNYTGDPNGTMISTDGSTWYTLEDATGGALSGTWNLRCFVTNQAKGGEVIALDDQKNGTPNGVFVNAGVSKQGNAPAYNSVRASIVKYNVYRSTDNVNYALIGEVAEAGQTLYEYFDSPAPGTYYYQVKAVYDNGCESTPALAFDDPTHDYVIGICDGISENSDNVALYPNPTSGNVTIEANGMSRITVVSVLGQVVFDTELNADTYTMNMAQFNAGLYMVRVYTEEGVTVKRVTVMQ